MSSEVRGMSVGKGCVSSSLARCNVWSAVAEHLPEKTSRPETPRASLLQVSETQNKAAQRDTKTNASNILAASAVAGIIMRAFSYQRKCFSLYRKLIG